MEYSSHDIYAMPPQCGKSGGVGGKELLLSSHLLAAPCWFESDDSAT